jgi:hypothetical protein
VLWTWNLARAQQESLWAKKWNYAKKELCDKEREGELRMRGLGV